MPFLGALNSDIEPSKKIGQKLNKKIDSVCKQIFKVWMFFYGFLVFLSELCGISMQNMILSTKGSGSAG